MKRLSSIGFVKQNNSSIMIEKFCLLRTCDRPCMVFGRSTPKDSFSLFVEWLNRLFYNECFTDLYNTILIFYKVA